MIDGSVVIPASQPDFTWNETNSEWDGLIIEVKYLRGQNSIENPVAPGDILVDQSPYLWKITQSEYTTGDRFKVSVKILNAEATQFVYPSTTTMRGIISTPNKFGFIRPHWDGTKVSDACYKLAMIYNFHMNEKFEQLIMDVPDMSDPMGLHTVTVDLNENGNINLGGTYRLPTGSDMKVDINPGTGFTLNSIVLDGTVLDTVNNPYIIQNVRGDHTVELVFSPEV